VAAARAAHNAAHATARALNALPPAASPIYLEQAVQDTPEVWAARAEHYKVIIISQVYISDGDYSRKYNFRCYIFRQAYATAAAANGVVASLPSLQPYYFQAIPDTPEVWEAKQAHFRAHAAARG
jgi:hypothetical protein